MYFEPDAFYHVFNQGNDRQRIFHNRENYLYFIKKVKRELAMHCHIIAYCLMPNHYHLLIMTPENNELVQSGFGRMQVLTRKIGTLQSSYTRALNKQNKSSGSVFRQKAKAKILETPDYQFACFHYIHQNPLRSGFVKHLKDWEFSSYPEYAGLRRGTLPNRKLAYQYLGIAEEAERFASEASGVIPENLVKKIW